VAAGWLRQRRADGSPGVTVIEDGDKDLTEQPLLAEVLGQARQTQDGNRHPERCLRSWDSPSLFGYLTSLRARGVLTWDRPKGGAVYGRFHLLDADAAAAALAGVERVATGAGPSTRDVDLAGIVHGIGLDKVLYKGRRDKPKLRALAAALEQHPFAVMTARVLSEIPGQKFTFDSRNDLRMARDMGSAQRWDL